ncbi:MAG TPA: hypothetical protein VGH89_03590 [Pseudonocardia sp.]|jgi:hypothetical protein
MSEISCAQCVELGPELALDTLSGEMRDQVVHHLDRCPRCRATVAEFIDTSDRLLELMPEIPPPPGFETRVLAALRTGAPRSRHWGVLAAAVVLAVVLVSAGWLVGSASSASGKDDDSQPGTRTLLYSPVTGGQGQLGQAYLYPDDPAWMYLSATPTQREATVECVAVKPDHSTTALGTFQLPAGRGDWQLTTAVPKGAVVVATVYGPNGKIMGKAQFPPRPEN